MRNALAANGYADAIMPTMRKNKPTSLLLLMTDKPKRVRRKPLPVTPAEIISVGLRAKAELERTEDAFLAVREELLEAIASSVPSDTQGRERASTLRSGSGAEPATC